MLRKFIFISFVEVSQVGYSIIRYLLDWGFGVMAEDNNVQKIERWKPMSKRSIGRPKTRWKDDVLEDIE